ASPTRSCLPVGGWWFRTSALNGVCMVRDAAPKESRKREHQRESEEGKTVTGGFSTIGYGGANQDDSGDRELGLCPVIVGAFMSFYAEFQFAHPCLCRREDPNA
ncbi:hypothetical protein M8C21_012392, partial [Ambrosia artemisiifolia]